MLATCGRATQADTAWGLVFQEDVVTESNGISEMSPGTRKCHYRMKSERFLC